MRRIKRIVVGTDFSAVAERALDEAVHLAVQVEAAITLVNACEIQAILRVAHQTPTMDAELCEKIVSAARSELAAAVQRRKGTGIEIRPLVRLGVPWEQIHDVAVRVAADLIVVGTHGRHRLPGVLLGSVAERVIRTATMPVMAVRDDAAGH
jgi:nucleotide-binding universal stress UspA family protein